MHLVTSLAIRLLRTKLAFTPETIAAAAIDRRDCSCCYAPQVRNEQTTPRGLRLGFCRGRKGYIGNIWAARHNK
jgi:hypothetical protein